MASRYSTRVANAASTSVEQFTQVGDDDIGAVALKYVPFPFPRDSDDQSKPAGSTGLDAGNRIFDDDRALRRHAKMARGGQERVRRRLAAQVQPTGHLSVHS